MLRQTLTLSAIALAAVGSGYAFGQLSSTRIAREPPGLASAVSPPEAPAPAATADPTPPELPTLAEPPELTPVPPDPPSAVRKSGKARSATTRRHDESRSP